MSVTVTRASTGPLYAPPGHTGVIARRLQGQEAGPSEAFWVGQSEYPPGAEAELSPARQESAYVVLDGELTFGVQEGEDVVSRTLRAGDSVRFDKGTVRLVRNDSAATARMLVIVAQPK